MTYSGLNFSRMMKNAPDNSIEKSLERSKYSLWVKLSLWKKLDNLSKNELPYMHI